MATASYLSQQRVTKQYDTISGIYDLLFTGLLNPGRKDVIQTINASGAHDVLEVGIGTGLSLPLYRPDMKITGVDISPKMIEKARRRREDLQLHNVRLLEMNAEKLAFPDNSFDAVVALYVVSATENPKRLLAELCRVCRPDGKIYILNHFTDRLSPMRILEKLFLPVARQLGWRSYFRRSQISLPMMRLVNSKRLNWFGYWQLLEYEIAPQ